MICCVEILQTCLAQYIQIQISTHGVEFNGPRDGRRRAAYVVNFLTSFDCITIHRGVNDNGNYTRAAGRAGEEREGRDGKVRGDEARICPRERNSNIVIIITADAHGE